MSIERSNPVRLGSAVEGRLTPVGSRDAFGRWRSSDPYQLFASALYHDALPLLWDDQQVSGAGTTSTYNANQSTVTLAVSAATAGKRVRQTFRRMPYQPSKSTLVTLTGVLGSPRPGIVTEIGEYDNKNGFIFRSTEAGIFVVLRSFVTGVAVDTVVISTSWDNSAYAAAINWDKEQIFWVDYQFLGAGMVRFGIERRGQMIELHAIDAANNLSVPYMSTPNLPLRYSIENTGAGGAASILCQCSAAVSEGNTEDVGFTRAWLRETKLTTLNDSNLYALLGLRLKTTHIGSHINIEAASVLCPSTAVFAWYLMVNPTIAGAAPTWVNGVNSALQTCVSTTNANTVTGGTAIGGDISISDVKNSGIARIGSPTGWNLGASIAGVPDELWLCAKRLTGTTEDFYAGITTGEVP